MPGTILTDELFNLPWPVAITNFPPSYFGNIPTMLMQPFSRVRRSSVLAADSYGDATFTEQTSYGYNGFVEQSAQKGEYMILGGKEIQYDAVVYTGATALIWESDRLTFYSSRSLNINAARYVVTAVQNVWVGNTLDHKQIYVKQEVV